MNSMPERTVNVMPWVLVVAFSRTAFMTASSTAHHSLTMLGLDSRHAFTSGASSSSDRPMSSAPIAFKAPTLPPYPRASSAILPFCLRWPLTPCFSTGTLNIWLAEAQ